MSLHEDNYNSNMDQGRFHSLKNLTPNGLMLSGLVGIFVFLVLLGIYFIFLNDNELKEGYKETKKLCTVLVETITSELSFLKAKAVFIYLT